MKKGLSNSLSVSWTAVTGAEGYVLQWKTAADPFFNASRQRTLTGAAFTHTGLTGAHTYRVFAVKRGEPHGPVSAEVTGSPSTTIDYDSDDDGLIEITKIEQLRAIHYDLDADGLVTGTNQSKYRAEFPSAVSYTGSTPLGCPSTGCKGYELRADLDFDQNSSYRVAANKTKWTTASPAVLSREGWWVIGYMDDGVSNSNRGSHVTASEFTGIFDGNNDSDAGDGGPYAISNLQIAVLGVAGDCGTGGNGNNYYIGLFGKLGSAGTIRDLTLKNVDVNIESALNTSCQGMKARVGGRRRRIGGQGGARPRHRLGSRRLGQHSIWSFPANVPQRRSRPGRRGGRTGQRREHPLRKLRRVRRLLRPLHPRQHGRPSGLGQRLRQSFLHHRFRRRGVNRHQRRYLRGRPRGTPAKLGNRRGDLRHRRRLRQRKRDPRRRRTRWPPGRDYQDTATPWARPRVPPRAD